MTAITKAEVEVMPNEIILAPRQVAPRWMTPDADPDPSAPFSGLYATMFGSHERALWQGAWEEALERWLSSGRRRSDHTRRTYRTAVMQWRKFVLEQHGVQHLWQVTTYHVQDWIHSMEAEGKKKRTIGARLAACSSFYDYCISNAAMLNGREICLMIDAYGNGRQNPFLSKTISRPKVEQFSDVVQVPADAYNWVMTDLRNRNEVRPCLENLRNYALMMAFGFSGWRNEEIISMTWGKVGENNQQKGQYTYRWTGKARDGAEEKRPLPAMVYNAVVAYLKEDGRWNPGHANHIQEDDYIWRPVRTQGCSNFSNVSRISDNRHITQSTCNGILQMLLRRYYAQVARTNGLDRDAAMTFADQKARGYSIHSLRHMFAWELYKVSGNNIHMVSGRLGHKSIATTQTYLKHLEEPVDDYSEMLARQLGLVL